MGRRQSGFSLLEILVAFAVLSLCLGVLLRIFAGGGQ
ncbi:MAG: type II secretion system protein, partial [Gammaproteobacteria bacterium]|nr:type II secretion system protein [Gammaproteobacteria bacterium]